MIKLRQRHVLVMLFIFILVFSITTYLSREITEDEYKYCTQVAEDIYNHKNDFLVEVPDNINYSKTEYKMQISIKGFRRGLIKGQLENGQIVFKREPQLGIRIVINVLLGVLASLVYLLIIMFCLERRLKKEER